MEKRITDFHGLLSVWLTGKNVTLFVVVICVLARIIQLVFFYNIRVDASYQVMATMHLVNGHGVSFAEVFASDLSSTHYKILVNWPPGYSILLAPFYLLFGGNYIAAGLCLDIVAATLLILISRELLKALDAAQYLRNLFTLLTSFFIYSFYFVASSDAIAIAFFIAAFYFYVLLLKNAERRIINTLFLAINLVICAWIKYLFIPVVFVIPVMLIIHGISGNNKPVKRSGALSFLVVSAGVLSLLLYQKLASGTAGYISQPERGFFPEHLQYSYPFIPASFLRPDTLEVFFNMNPATVYTVFQLIHLLALIPCLIWFRTYVTNKGFRKIDPKEGFLYSSFIISIGIFLLLAVLSLGVAREEILPGVFWTYIEETRYYGLVYVLIHLSLFVYFRQFLKKFRLFFVFMLFIFFAEAARGFFFTARRVILVGKETYSWQVEDRFQRFAEQVILDSRVKQPVSRVVIAGSSYYMNHRVSLYSGVPILYDQGKLNMPDSIYSKEPTLLLVMLQQNEMEKFSPFLAAPRKELAGQFNGFYFYTMYVGTR